MEITRHHGHHTAFLQTNDINQFLPAITRHHENHKTSWSSHNICVSRIEDNSDSQSYSASDRDTVSGVNVDTDVKVEYQQFPCEYCGKMWESI